jgi:2-(1,2-epoxy-1,2-dihydrophenyl)acetyl-CoA isomerase
MPNPVEYLVDGGVATVTLNRPESMNSLDTVTKDALLAALRAAADDEAARCVVVAGRGRAFCVGQDLREHAELLASQSLEEVWATVDRHYSPIALTLSTMPKPVVAAVNGVAAGAGLSIALACDFRVAAESAGFNTAFVAVGLSCDTGSSWSLPRVVGPAVARDLLMRPRTVSATDALEMGLVTAVVPDDELSATAAGLAAELAAGPTLAYAAVKEAVAYASAHSLADALTLESELMARTGGSQDHRSAVESFLAKQKPTFKGS